MSKQNYRGKREKDFKKIYDLPKSENKSKKFSKVSKSEQKSSRHVRDEVESNVRYKGKMIVNVKGFGFFVPEQVGMEDVFISSSNLNGAYNGDVVEIVLLKSKGFKSREGKVVNIIYRGNRVVVGNFLRYKKGGYVSPDMRNINKDVYIEEGKTMNAKKGDKVVVKILDYGSESSFPTGEIIEIIGDMSRKGDDIIAIIRNYELIEEFPEEVKESVKKIPTKVTSKELVGRVDFRDKLTCTIDGEDARDFDDAISIEKLGKGYKLYVHIADVGHYVPKDSIIDKEAFKRGTSVYFPDMVLPMLPKELSNGICSLNPKEDRLVLTVVAELNENADVVNYKICEGVINSNERMTYKDVYSILCGDVEVSKRYKDLVPSFLLMSELNKKLEEKRNIRGALDFDIPETYVKVDEKGKTIAIEERERNEAHRIIESFMILANEIVAKEYQFLKIPFVYRVHETPTAEKMEDFFTFASTLGFDTKMTSFNKVKPKDLQNIINKAKDSVYSKTLSEVMLRSLQKAKYFPECLGHFGLASTSYCHFTSPIRRYPDLTIHRIIKDRIHNKINESNIADLKEFVDESCVRSSEREQLAEKAEREVVAFKKCEFMVKFIGSDFEGYVSGVTANGVFIELPNTVEGFSSIDHIPDDIYELDEKNYCLRGQKHKYLIGQPVKVKIAAVNMDERKIDFQILH
jgi:ribonuclease R